MKQFIADLKENKLFKVYIIIFSLLNVIYMSLIGAKFYYADKYGLDGTIKMDHYEYLARISRITRSIQTIILIIFVVYLVKVIMKQEKINLKEFIIIHISYFSIIIFINFIISIIFPISFWNLIEVLFGPIQITIMVLIVLLITGLYKKIFKNSKS